MYYWQDEPFETLEIPERLEIIRQMLKEDVENERKQYELSKTNAEAYEYNFYDDSAA